MPRRLALFAAVAIVLVTAAAAPSGARPTSTAAGSARTATHTITVNLTCGNDTDDWVSDSTVTAKRGDTIEWVLTPESNVVDFKVRKKRWYNRWLFERPDVPGRPGEPARGNDMKPDAEGRYRYEIIGRCQGPEKAEIDPDIIIEI